MTDTSPLRGNQAAFAAYKAVSRQTVTDWKQRGLLAFAENGDVDFEATDKRLVNHGIRQPIDTNLTESALVDAADIPWSLAEAERVKENYSARLKRLEYERAVEQVVLVDDAATHVRNEFSLVRDRVRQISSEVTSQLVEMTSAEEIKAALEELSVLKTA